MSDEVYHLRDAVAGFVAKIEPSLDKNTLLWCIKNICQSGMSITEALSLLQIKDIHGHYNNNTQRRQ